MGIYKLKSIARLCLLACSLACIFALLDGLLCWLLSTLHSDSLLVLAAHLLGQNHPAHNLQELQRVLVQSNYGAACFRPMPNSTEDITILNAPCTQSISGLVVEYIVAIDVTRVRFPADAFMVYRHTHIHTHTYTHIHTHTRRLRS